MTIGKELLAQLTQSMNEYNSNANSWVEAIAHGLSAIGFIVIAVMMLLAMAKTSEKFREGMGAPLDFEVMLQISMSYLLAVCAVILAPNLMDALVWAGNAVSKIIATTGGLSNGQGPAASNLFDPSHIKMNYLEKMVFNFWYSMNTLVWSAVNLLVGMLVFLRFISLCIFKALSPVMVAMSITEDYRSIPINFWKQVLAIILQGCALMLILKLFPIFLTSDTMNIDGKIAFSAWVGLASQSVLKGGAVIFFIFQSQSLSRRLIGV